MTTTTTSPKPASFEQEATSVLSRMGTALADVIDAVAGEIRTALALERTFELDRKLSWRIFKIARATEPLKAGGHVPGRVSIKRFLAAAAKRGASSELLESVETVYQDFERLIETHAGDRSSFDSIVSGFDQTAAEQMGLVQRRATFRGQRHILGIQARTQLLCFVLHPGVGTKNDDLLSIRGLVDLSQTRHHRAWTISRAWVGDSDESQLCTERSNEPLDTEAKAMHGVALLQEFCSNPLPQIQTFKTKAGHTQTQLMLEAVGKDSSATCMLGDVWRDTFARYRDAHNCSHEAFVLVRTPVETLILDVLVYEGMYGRITPTAFALSDHEDTSATIIDRERDLLDMNLSATYMGQGPSVLDTPNVPRYPEMAQYAFDRLGWDGENFDVYRCRVQFPVMPSSVVVRFDLPEKP